MNLPGFDAEWSLGPTTSAYVAKNVFSGTARGTVLPARRRQQSCATKYGAYISHYFPVTVCRPIFNDLSNSVATMARVGPGALNGTFGPRAGTVLKSESVNKIGALQDCRTVALPFIADVTTRQNCEDSIPDSSELVVYGHPELTAVWTGGIENIPAPYNSGWFGVTASSCSCCAPLVECPDGRCVPRNVSCDQHPA